MSEENPAAGPFSGEQSRQDPDAAGHGSAVDRHSSLLLEIGTEEIPARFLPPALTMLRENTGSLFSEYLIGFSEIKTYATPRRLAVMVKGIPAMQGDRIKEIYGPAKKAAFDEAGNPTRAALGFAGSQGVNVADLVIKNKDKGEYVAAVIRQEGVAVKLLLPEVLKKVILSLNFPKSMRWGSGSLRFVRPIHWILTLFDGETIPFEIDAIRSGNLSRGHRFLSPGSFAIKEIPAYIRLLENNYVVIDQDERKRMIERGIENIASSVGGRTLKDEELLETVTHLVEYPTPVLCEFPADYLRLPRELLITVMKGHQKYFAVEGEDGALRNHFIVVSNTKDENAETIRAGAERVIKARFEDARFYYEEDVRKPLRTRIEELRRVTFHDRLGSLYDKTDRVAALASFLAEKLSPGKKTQIEKAARLSKTDLITGVVGEFPELQGLMGKYYALNDGEEREVAEAILQQYLPAHSGDSLPGTDEGSVLSLSDKIDNVVSFFAIGLIPSGSEDPFALRRQALAVIAILTEKRFDITLKEMIGKAAERAVEERPSLTSEVLNFFVQRMEPLLSSQNVDSDVIQSVIHLVDSVPLWEIRERIRAMRKFTSDTGYNGFLLAVKRISNIIPPTEAPELSPDLLLEPQEKALAAETMNIKPVLRGFLSEKKYYEAITLLNTLTPFINDFFDRVLVMDKRDEVRLNRFALLKEIWSMASLIADFSKLRER
jgi:glycyl-tRNA synthetase beta chain